MNFEQNLVEQIQPIRQFVLASAIQSIFASGVYDAILEEEKNIDMLACEIKLDKNRLRGLLEYLVNEGLVSKYNGNYKLSQHGKQLKDVRPWYEMMIGGYGVTFTHLTEGLKNSDAILPRNIASVGIGSCGMSHYDAFPLTQRLLKAQGVTPHKICDLGCGNAYYLTEFCKYFGNVHTIGVEPNQESVDAAIAHIADTPYANQIEVIADDAISFAKSDKAKGTDLFMIGFVLHEILGQENREGVKNFLQQIIKSNPKSYIMVIEVDDQISDQKAMAHGLAKAYYNPYYLLHYFTNQKLAPRDFWNELFTELDFEICQFGYPDNGADSTDLALGYLLRKKI